MTDSYHTVGAQQDRAATLKVQNRIATALEQIAKSLTVMSGEKELGAMTLAELSGDQAADVDAFLHSEGGTE